MLICCGNIGWWQETEPITLNIYILNYALSRISWHALCSAMAPPIIIISIGICQLICSNCANSFHFDFSTFTPLTIPWLLCVFVWACLSVLCRLLSNVLWQNSNLNSKAKVSNQLKWAHTNSHQHKHTLTLIHPIPLYFESKTIVIEHFIRKVWRANIDNYESAEPGCGVVRRVWGGWKTFSCARSTQHVE